MDILEKKIKEVKALYRLKKKAKALVEKGLTYRQVGFLVGKSHQWVKNVCDELSTEERK